ncbi:hypothetical protein [Okeania sp. SIO1I7]|uniref:hypothetical protein n=1 Tax=Okeania sp. SIO1I7 TaxID=2607772 RepID=UPI0013F7727A|nr:hypothetical protein [Okeania sp. SIO1I7]NET27014.1 hypothetical protein [Okeania sp. SIO1I7]
MKPTNSRRWIRIVLCALVIVAIALSTTTSPVMADETKTCEANIRYEVSTPWGKTNSQLDKRGSLNSNI